jgi:acyl carrier protein
MNENVERIMALFRDRLAIEVMDADTDLVVEGLMDSLMLVDLLTLLEEEYEITIGLSDLDIGNFRSVATIARFVESRTTGSANASSGRPDHQPAV